MPDFFVSDPEDTLFTLRDKEGKELGSIDAIDIIDILRIAREKAEDAGDLNNWFVYFDKDMMDRIGVRVSKTQAILLVREAEVAFSSLKKSGLEDSEQQEQLEESTTSQNETTES